ncbi:toll/interleukin-1 receptor domain-containing protein [Streptomyces malaysiensis]|uniref:toll/interleukin-1 receptor domain-containing protein n=1 Tax=Streptomyces malaysiensis TaxID=92644 RepID=UPI0011CE72E4|nr:toll/interleukin-1 receptor domain-containing protein [Streptomyces malaysiensis]
MAQIFINYRRSGGAYAAALLDEILSKRFSKGQVFRAGRSIKPGSDYVESILEAVARCDAMLVIVDEGWSHHFANANNPPSRRDWVLREIEEAFKHERTVIPILLSGVKRIGDEEDLPSGLHRLTRLQYLRFDYRNILQDSNYIADRLAVHFLRSGEPQDAQHRCWLLRAICKLQKRAPGARDS